MTATAPPPFLGQLIGQAERATRAVLDAELDAAGIEFLAWVTLRLAATGATPTDRAGLAAAVARARQIAPAAAAHAVDDVVGAGWLAASTDGGALGLTATGRDRHDQVAALIAVATDRLYGDLPAADVDATRRVLTEMTVRAEAALMSRR